jgi:hypothetical protein
MKCDMQLGKLAEMQFCIDAAKRGFNVSIPQSDFTGYDLVIESNSKKLYKIQVKSTRQKSEGRNCYKVSVARGSQSKKTYKKNELDFFAVYIYEINQWYLIPFNVVKSINVRIYPSKPTHVYSQFQEAWHLIK